MAVHRHAPRRLSATSIAVLVLIVALVVGLVARQPVIALWEDVSIVLFPSADRAMRYGERHLDARNVDAYDTQRAEDMFHIAARLDPNTPYVYHELARIAFLRGNFQTALQLITLQIEKTGDSEPNSYYVRGLIEGYMGEYAAAEADYSHFLQSDPKDWAAMNDYAWILLKAKKPEEALIVTTQGLATFPDNPWLLNSNAIALYELGKSDAAFAVAQNAVRAVQKVTIAQWLTAYPGNNPRDAQSGIDSLKNASTDNMHMIADALATSTVQ